MSEELPSTCEKRRLIRTYLYMGLLVLLFSGIAVYHLLTGEDTAYKEIIWAAAMVLSFCGAIVGAIHVCRALTLKDPKEPVK